MPAIVMLPASFTVTVDAVPVTVQVTEATLAFDTSTTTIKTLVEETDYQTGEKCTLTLAAYQDWTADQASSICWLLWNSAGIAAPFEITGTDEAGATVTASGTATMRRPNFGPTADDAAKFSIDIPVIGIPDLTLTPGGGALAAGARADAA
jgi:hypothetical protein